MISLNKLKLVSFYIVTYLLQQCIDLGLCFYKHNVPQLRSSHPWSGIRHKYVFHSHEEKSATARNEGWRPGHSPLGRGLDACHILQGTRLAINQITSYWQNATGENVSLSFFYTRQVFPRFSFFFCQLKLETLKYHEKFTTRFIRVKLTTVEALVSEQLYLRPPSQDPFFLNSHTNSVFLHSRK